MYEGRPKLSLHKIFLLHPNGIQKQLLIITSTSRAAKQCGEAQTDQIQVELFHMMLVARSCSGWPR